MCTLSFNMALITKANDVVVSVVLIFCFFSSIGSLIVTPRATLRNRVPYRHLYWPSKLGNSPSRLLVITNLPYVISFDVFAITVNLPGRFAHGMSKLLLS